MATLLNPNGQFAGNPNGIGVLFRFRIGEAGQLIPCDGSGGVSDQSKLDLQKTKAGPATLTVVHDPAVSLPTNAAGGQVGAPNSINDYLNLAKAIAIPQPPAGLPFSMLTAAFVVSWQSLVNQPANSVTPQTFVELSPSPAKGFNF
jgi:hypothetical protein